MTLISLESRMQGRPARPVRGGLGGNWRRTACSAVIPLHKDNPKASNQVVIGLFFIVFASSVTALISFT